MILFLDTTDQKVVEVILKDKGKVVVKKSYQNQLGSQALLPGIVEVLGAKGLDFCDITRIELAKGAGSFTGLRVGASVAQSLGFALNIPVNGDINKPIKLSYT